jgi:hypothetical protein
MKTYSHTMDGHNTALWDESDARLRDQHRRAVRADLAERARAANCGRVEVCADDGVVLDAWILDAQR